MTSPLYSYVVGSVIVALGLIYAVQSGYIGRHRGGIPNLILCLPIPFGRHFSPQVRNWAAISLLIYLVGYIGAKHFTLGPVLNILLGRAIPVSALVVAMVTMTDVTAGGQTSVIMPDLIQGVLLLVVGVVILYLGISCAFKPQPSRTVVGGRPQSKRRG